MATQDNGPFYRQRHQRLDWDQYFMAIALLSAERSKDINRQVGACIVNNNNRILGIGYNGMPDGVKDDDELWKKEEKENYVCHAELNAIVNRGGNDIKGCSLYVTYFPCLQCTKLIIQSGIDEVIYLENPSPKREDDVEKVKSLLGGRSIDVLRFSDVREDPTVRKEKKRREGHSKKLKMTLQSMDGEGINVDKIL